MLEYRIDDINWNHVWAKLKDHTNSSEKEFRNPVINLPLVASSLVDRRCVPMPALPNSSSSPQLFQELKRIRILNHLFRREQGDHEIFAHRIFFHPYILKQPSLRVPISAKVVLSLIFDLFESLFVQVVPESTEHQYCK